MPPKSASDTEWAKGFNSVGTPKKITFLKTFCLVSYRVSSLHVLLHGLTTRITCVVLSLLTNMPPKRNWQHTVTFDDGSTYTGAGATRKDVGTARSPQPTGTATRACARTTRRMDMARRLRPQGQLRGRKLRWQEAWARYEDLGQWGQVRWRGARWQGAWAGHAHWAPGELLRGRVVQR